MNDSQRLHKRWQLDPSIAFLNHNQGYLLAIEPNLLAISEKCPNSEDFRAIPGLERLPGGR